MFLNVKIALFLFFEVCMYVSSKAQGLSQFGALCVFFFSFAFLGAKGWVLSGPHQGQ